MLREKDSAVQPVTVPESPKIRELPGLNKEDWFMIDEALHQVARSLRKIEQEEKRKKAQVAAYKPSATH